MIDAPALLADCQAMVRTLVDDLRIRCGEVPEVDDVARRQWLRAQAAGRTAHSYETWREGWQTQVAAAWALGCVFVRFCEDNGLVDEALLSGPGERRRFAQDNRQLHLRDHPAHSDRDWLLAVFDRYRNLPGLGDVLGAHNPLWQAGPSADGARGLVELWWRIVPTTGAIVHDFTDSDLGTRFLGDLYQDLSEDARKDFALLQTPDFIEAFLLDRTLDPAIEEFGLSATSMIDPTCGSGHLCLGSFARLFRRWVEVEPQTNLRVLAQRALDGVHGVDLNPFAVAIARFRLLVAALRACGEQRLAGAPDFQVKVAVADSLLYGTRSGRWLIDDTGRYAYETEDAEKAHSILSERYRVCVGNPPYTVVRDKALSDAYRRHYETCYRQYSLGVPFTERFVDLAQRDGYIGMITANSFMKREFGRRLIEDYLPSIDLTHVIDTSGARIPGHGTPTVIMLLRGRPPTTSTVRGVLGIRMEPTAPEDPAKGQVWSAIVSQVDRPGSESEWVSATDIPRERLARHPWSIGGGGAAELKDRIEIGTTTLGTRVWVIGRVAHTSSDDSYFAPANTWTNLRVASEYVVPIVEGDVVRDWSIRTRTEGLFPYDVDFRATSADPVLFRTLWLTKTHLRQRREPNGFQEEIGLTWFEWSRFHPDRFGRPLGIAMAFVTTHNHFALDRGGKVFNRSAPVIKLPKAATEEDHLHILGLLNSSTACFWMLQTFHNKGNREGTRWTNQQQFDEFYEFDATKLQQFPLAATTPAEHASTLDALGSEMSNISVLESVPSREALQAARERAQWLRARMIGVQEELDWFCYRSYGLVDEDLTFALDEIPPLRLGERAFEIVLARRMKAGDVTTSWFERHGSTPITELPEHWPKAYRDLITQRMKVIETDRDIALIEQPEYKRRWAHEPWDELERRSLHTWLLDRLEDQSLWPERRLTTAARLADLLRLDSEFLQVAQLYAGADVDLAPLVAALVADEAVPYLAGYRYKESGLRKRAEWERTWESQRAEDAIEARTHLPEDYADRLSPERAAALKGDEVGDIPLPPKYGPADFSRTTYWRLRGKLDVPKERFISYPGAERENDPTAVLGWAGWNHLERARALAGWYTEQRDAGIAAERLLPLLAGLWELVPWLRQWHNETDPTYGERMGDFFASFVTEQAAQLGKTTEDLAAWRPQASASRGKGRKP